MKLESFFECLDLCVSFILRGDLVFAQVKGEIWGRIHEIQDLGSDLLSQRLTDLTFDLEETFDVLAECKANLAHNAHRLFERRWADQEREMNILSVSLTEAQS